MNINVRKEAVRCACCNKVNEFLYLSDFAYGKRLVLFGEHKKYAYINLLKDDTYNNFIYEIENILKANGIIVSDQKLQDIVNNIFEITCDKIQGGNVDFANVNKKCVYCASEKFEDLLVEPEKNLYIDVPNVTHEIWENTEDKDKMQMIENALQNNGII